MKLPIYLSQKDVEALLKAIPNDHFMIHELTQLLQQLMERTDQLAELSARARTTQWWDDAQKPREKKIKETEGQKLLKKLKKLTPEILAIFKKGLL